MEDVAAARAVAAGSATARALGLQVEDAVILQSANRLALHLRPGDVLARVAPAAQQVAQFELTLAQQLVAAGAPVGALEPRVEPRAYERDGFVTTLWTYYEPVAGGTTAPVDYAAALAQLHAGMRTLDVETPHFLDRVEQARQLVTNRDVSPALADTDRELLAAALDLGRRIADQGRAEQLLHGEPHPGNLLTTTEGPLFIDFETACRGPVEFDLAHAPDDVGEHYPGADPALLRACRVLVLAMITAWRWDVGDQFPDGRQLGIAWLHQLRAQFEGSELDPRG